MMQRYSLAFLQAPCKNSRKAWIGRCRRRSNFLKETVIQILAIHAAALLSILEDKG